MNALARCLALGALVLVAAPLGAQAPMRPMPAGPAEGGAMAGASFLLARVGELQLTDAQVVRLAAVARREAAQRRAMMANMDSLRRTAMATRRDSAIPRRREVPPQLESRLNEAREQRQANLRDAIAVLTPDQQAQAWQMIGRGGMRGGMRERMMGDRVPQGRGMAPARPNGLRREGARRPTDGPGVDARGMRAPRPARPE